MSNKTYILILILVGGLFEFLNIHSGALVIALLIGFFLCDEFFEEEN